jgi:hypothetical protein
MQDLKYALRQFLRHRGFTTTAILVLAIGVFSEAGYQALVWA